MKTASRILFLLVAVAIVAACSRSAFDAQVERAEALMDSAPDSALAIAEALNPGNRAEQARAALLLTKARYKAYVPLTDDSLISIAADYYSGRNDSLETQALFLLGETYFTLQQYDKALISAIKGEKTAEACGNIYFKALSIRLQADIYHMCYDFDTEVEVRKKGIEAFKQCSKTEHVVWGKLAYCIALTQEGEYAKSMKELDCLQDVVDKNNLFFQSEYYRLKGINHYAIDSFPNVIIDFENFSNTGIEKTSHDLSLLSRAYVHIGNKQNAKLALDSSFALAESRADSSSAYLSLSMLQEANNNFKEALATYQTKDSILGSEMDYLLTHPFQSLVAQHFQHENEKFALNIRSQRQTIIFWVVTSVLLLILLVCIYTLLKRTLSLKHNEILLLEKESESLKDEISKFKSSLKTANTDLEQANLIIEQNKLELHRANTERRQAESVQHLLAMDRLSINNNICYGLYKFPAHAIDAAKARSIFTKTISSFTSDDMIDNLAKLVDAQNNNIYSKICESCPKLSTKQRLIFLLCALKFTPEAAAILTNTDSVNGFYSVKSRLKKILLEAMPQHIQIINNILATKKV